MTEFQQAHVFLIASIIVNVVLTLGITFYRAYAIGKETAYDMVLKDIFSGKIKIPQDIKNTTKVNVSDSNKNAVKG